MALNLNFIMELHPFGQSLWQENYAGNTIVAYTYAVREYFGRYSSLNKQNLLDYKNFLVSSYKPKTVNVRIRALNKYLEFEQKPKLKLKSIRMPKNTFLENVISCEEYKYLKGRLRKESDLRWYFIVWTLAATGARISELVRMRVEHVRAGHFDICSKGGKIRRMYFPGKLREEMLAWVDRRSGSLFLNSRGKPLTPRGISMMLKELAESYGINPAVVHPHSFRHLFAKNFLRRENDVTLLADLLGHETVETTRIYLQRSSDEQRELIDEIVDW